MHIYNLYPYIWWKGGLLDLFCNPSGEANDFSISSHARYKALGHQVSMKYTNIQILKCIKLKDKKTLYIMVVPAPRMLPFCITFPTIIALSMVCTGLWVINWSPMFFTGPHLCFNITEKGQMIVPDKYNTFLDYTRKYCKNSVFQWK